MRSLITTLILLSLASAQYSQEWEVQQDLYERGILYFDVNQDNTPDITKFLWNTVTIYDGANNFDVIWSVADDTYENLILWDLYDFDQDSSIEAIFIRSNTIDTVTTALMMIPALLQNIAWVSQEYSGTVSYVDVEDMDGDNNVEIVFGVYRYDVSDSSYYSIIYVLDSQNGTEQWSSPEMQGYITGPYLGDMDNDGTVEIMINLYDYKAENYLLRVYGYSGTTNSISNSSITSPDVFSMRPNYPNPFNNTTIIPVTIHQRTPVDINVIDANGREVTNILHGELAPGRYQFSWHGKDNQGRTLPSGIYYYRIITDKETKVRPMVLLK